MSSSSHPQRILVTGATSGIGLELARQLAGPEVELWIVGRKPALLAETATELRKRGGVVHEVLFDLTDEAACAEFLTDWLGRIERLDAAYLAAGISIFGEAKDLSQEDWARIYRTNLLSVIQWTCAIYPKLVEQRGGRLILISSLAAYAGYPMSVPYAAAKAGLLGLYRTLSHESKLHGVDVHLASPGYVNTGIFRSASYHGTSFEETMEVIEGMMLPILPANRAAQIILEKVRAGRHEFCLPFHASILAWFAQRFPLVPKLVHRYMLSLHRQPR